MNEKIIADIQHNYGLEIKGQPIPIKGGLEHLTYVAEAATKKYVVRVYRNREKRMAENEATLLVVLHKVSSISSAIVKMLPSKAGVFINETDGIYYCLFEYIDGFHPIKLADHELDHLIKLIKGIHVCGLSEVAKYSHRGLPDSRPMLSGFSSAFQKNEIKEWQLATFQQIITEFNKTSINYTTRTVIHYDVHLPNLLVSNKTKSLVLIDFDDFIVSSPIFELAVMVRGLCFNGHVFDADFAVKILTKYDLRSGIESRFNADEFMLFILFDLVRVCDACINRGEGDEKHKTFSLYYAKLVYLVDNYQQIVNKFASFNNISRLVSALPVSALQSTKRNKSPSSSSSYLASVNSLIAVGLFACACAVGMYTIRESHKSNQKSAPNILSRL